MEKTIEIPFGAKDSELKGWEYTIPEGMEAEIKDGKIIVKQKESEDERIRKHIIDIIKDNAKSKCIPCDAEIAYLEKLKKFQFGYPGIYFYDGEFLHFQGNPAMEKKQKEQNPEEWNDDDEICAHLILRELEKVKKDSPEYSKHFARLIDWFTCRFKSLRPQSHQTVEDKSISEEILGYFNEKKDYRSRWYVWVKYASRNPPRQLQKM